MKETIELKLLLFAVWLIRLLLPAPLKELNISQDV